jgi:hypothetical protein
LAVAGVVAVGLPVVVVRVVFYQMCRILCPQLRIISAMGQVALAVISIYTQIPRMEATVYLEGLRLLGVAGAGMPTLIVGIRVVLEAVVFRLQVEREHQDKEMPVATAVEQV